MSQLSTVERLRDIARRAEQLRCSDCPDLGEILAEIRGVADLEADKVGSLRAGRSKGGLARAMNSRARAQALWEQALNFAGKLRAARPDIAQAELARRIHAVFGARLPGVAGITKKIAEWEAANALPRRLVVTPRSTINQAAASNPATSPELSL